MHGGQDAKQLQICEGPITFQHCLLQGNREQNMIAEAHQVTVTDCDITDGLYFRNLEDANDPSGYRNGGVQNISVTGNRFYGSASIGFWGNMDAAYNTAHNVVTTPNDMGLDIATLNWSPTSNGDMMDASVAQSVSSSTTDESYASDNYWDNYIAGVNNAVMMYGGGQAAVTAADNAVMVWLQHGPIVLT